MADVRLPDIKASVKVDSKDVDAGLKRVEASTKGAGAGFEGLATRARGSLDGIKDSLNSNAAGIALAGAAIAKVSIDAASNLAESQSKVQQVFGESAGEIEKFASSSARSLGLSKTAAFEATGTFGNLFVQLGTGSGEAAKMSTEMSTLAADFASFHNADITQVIEAQTAAFRGEYDAVQRFVPTINAAAVEQQALAMGLAGTSKELTAQDKAMATYTLLMQGAGKAQGDFARTSDGLANQQRILKAQLQDLSAELGNALIPMLTRAGSVIIPVVTGVSDLADKVGGLGKVAGTVAGAMNPLVGLLDLLPGKQKKSSDAADGQKASAEGLTGATEALTGATKGGTEAATAAASATAKQAAALDKIATATLGALSSQLGYERSVNTLKDNINDLDDRTEEYSAAVAKNGANSKEAETANRALRDAHHAIKESALNAAGAAVRLAEDTAAAGGETLSAQAKAEIFRSKLEELAGEADGPTRDAIGNLATDIDNIPNRTVTIDVDLGNAYAHIAALERRISTISSGGDSTSGPQQFALGLDMGPVRGSPGQAVPIIAHAGEYVVTPAQLADLRGSPAPGVPTAPGPAPSSAPAGHGHDIILDGMKVGVAVAPGVAKGMYQNRRR